MVSACNSRTSLERDNAERGLYQADVALQGWGAELGFA